MAFTQSSEPAPTAAKFGFLDSASPGFISASDPTPEERLEEAARDGFALSSVAVTASCFSGLLCSYLTQKEAVTVHLQSPKTLQMSA